MTTLTPINLGTAANNGTGDTLRAGGQKINDNFNALNNGKQELNTKLSAIAANVWLVNQVLIMTGADTLGALTTGTVGRALMAAATAADGRLALALGTSSTRNVMASVSDDSDGTALMPIGAFGFGGQAISTSDLNTLVRGGMYALSGSTANVPTGYPSGSVALQVSWSSPSVANGIAHQILSSYNGNDFAFRVRHATNGWFPTRTLWHDGNMNPTVLQSAASPQNLPVGNVTRVAEAVYAARLGFGYYSTLSTVNLDNEPGGSVGLYGPNTSGTMPSATNWWIETQQTYTVGSRYQMAVSYAGSATTGALMIPKVKMRLSNQPGTVWGAWIDFITSDNVDASVRAAVLTGLSVTNTGVVATDSVLAAIGKLQGQLDSVPVTVRTTPLTGLSTATATAVTAADTVLAAMGKLQAQINTANTNINNINNNLSANVRAVPLAGLSTATGTDVVATDTILAAIGKLQAQAIAATPVARGGTGGTTAAAARTNLGLKAAAIADVVGLVAGGAALFETVNNGNGIAFKFVTGLQICYLWGANTPVAAVNGYTQYTWTFPSPFNNTAYWQHAFTTPTVGWDTYGVVGAMSKNTSQVTFQVRNGAASAQNYAMDMIAIGTWG